MNFYVKDKLNIDEYTNVLGFLSSLSFYCIEQHPDWNAKIETYPHNFFFSTDQKGVINCFANIILSKGPFNIASINFGPAFSDYKVLTKAIEFLHAYFSTQKYIFFSIQLGIEINNQTELLEYHINHNFKVTYHFKPGNLWSSIYVDLTRPENEILNSFSNGHRRRIKNSFSKNGIIVKIKNDEDLLQLFIRLYIKMCKLKNLQYNEKDITSSFNGINSFIYENNKGFMVYIFQKDDLVGGMVIIYQGNSARVYKGATDPERRDIPISHSGILEAIKLCKAKGFLILDLWGYNHFAKKNDSVYSINEFKKGFSNSFNFFPKKMNFVLNPINYNIYMLLKFCKKAAFIKKSNHPFLWPKVI